MGLLDQLLGGAQQGGQRGGGGLSPIALALIAMLAQRGMQGGAQGGAQGGGGLGDLLGGLLGGQARGAPPSTGAPAGGGLGDLLGGLLGGLGQARGAAPSGGAPAGGGLGDILGSILGGQAQAGPRLNGGLADMLRQFEQSGLGDAAGSWVGREQNRQIAPRDIERALGRDTVESLSTQTGRSYLDVLSELSESLPDTVDRLTPDGRLATNEEASRWI